MRSDTLLSLETVSKSFGQVRALDGVTLGVAAGERVALLGHNGAGKTTLIRLVLGFTRPDRGAISIRGESPGSDTARNCIAYLPESVTFPKTLTGREIIRFYARLKHATKLEAEAALARVGLAEAGDRRTGTYSKGMRQRLGLAQALVGKPQLMLLDEPTSGLDPLSRADFYTLVNDIAAAGTGIVLSSHSLDEIEARTDRIVILRSGQVVADAPLARLQREAGLPIRISVRTTPETTDAVNAQLGGRRINGQAVELICPASEKMALLQAIMALGPAVTDLEMRQSSLDEVYRHFSRQPAGESGT